MYMVPSAAKKKLLLSVSLQVKILANLSLYVYHMPANYYIRYSKVRVTPARLVSREEYHLKFGHCVPVSGAEITQLWFKIGVCRV